jgi:hypothetical protein
VQAISQRERGMVCGKARSTFVLAIAAAILAGPARAQPETSPDLVIELRCAPTDRLALREALAGAELTQLAAARAAGRVTAYRILVSRGADDGGWDAEEVLSFSDAAARGAWSGRGDGSGGLAPSVLHAVRSVITTPAEHVCAIRGRHEAGAVYLAIPYALLVPVPDYVRYADGYIVPQFSGWIRAGVLDGYDIDVADLPTGRPWGATIWLRYHDDASLAKRDQVTTAVRAELAADPAWKAISDAKQQVRTERAAVVASVLAEAGD